MIAALRRFLRYRSRFAVSVVFGAVAWALLWTAFPALERALLAWDSFVWLFLGLIWTMFVRTPPERTRVRYEEEDDSPFGLIVIVCLGAIASLLAVILLLGGKAAGSASSQWSYLLTAATVLGAWALVPTVFTLHYADMFYSAPADARPLGFADKIEVPGYWDFMYYAFTVAVASQTADVVTCSTAARRATLVQAILSFFFNAAVIGFAINVAAGLAGPH